MSNTARYQNPPTLTIQEGYGVVREIAIRKPELVIGRDSDCDIVINDRNVSRHHLRITEDSGGLVVTDLGSANGTFVNSSPITSKHIKHMDLIQIGSVMIVL